MITIKTIQNEIRQIPINRLEEVYKLIRTFHRPVKVEKTYKSKIMSFAGIFSDLSESDYNDFVAFTQKNRNELFNRDSTL